MDATEYQLRIQISDLTSKCFQLDVKVTELQEKVDQLDKEIEERIRRKLVEQGVIEPAAEDE